MRRHIDFDCADGVECRLKLNTDGTFQVIASRYELVFAGTALRGARKRVLSTRKYTTQREAENAITNTWHSIRQVGLAE